MSAAGCPVASACANSAKEPTRRLANRAPSAIEQRSDHRRPRRLSWRCGGGEGGGDNAGEDVAGAAGGRRKVVGGGEQVSTKESSIPLACGGAVAASCVALGIT